MKSKFVIEGEDFYLAFNEEKAFITKIKDHKSVVQKFDIIIDRDEVETNLDLREGNKVRIFYIVKDSTCRIDVISTESTLEQIKADPYVTIDKLIPNLSILRDVSYIGKRRRLNEGNKTGN